MKEALHVAFASDDAGVDGLAVPAWSSLQHATRPVHSWIIEEGIDHGTQDRLRQIWGRAAMSATVNFIAQRSLPLKLPSWWAHMRWPLLSAARFQLAEVLPPDARRCIYLDIDTLVGADLGELFDTDLRGCPVGMVINSGMNDTDRDYVRTLGLDADRYCNAGVLLIDLKRGAARVRRRA